MNSKSIASTYMVIGMYGQKSREKQVILNKVIEITLLSLIFTVNGKEWIDGDGDLCEYTGEVD